MQHNYLVGSSLTKICINTLHIWKKSQDFGPQAFVYFGISGKKIWSKEYLLGQKYPQTHLDY